MTVLEFISLQDIAFNPDNPREEINTSDLEDINSASDMNVPLIVRPYSAEDAMDVPICGYVLIDGNRRATRIKVVDSNALLPIGEKVIVLPVSREEARYITLKTFFKKSQLTLKEECRIIAREKTINPNLSTRKLAEKIGVNHSWLRRRIYINDLSDDEQEEFFSGKRAIRTIFQKEATDNTDDNESVSRDTPTEVVDVDQSKAQITLCLSNKEFIFFEKNYHHLCSKYNDIDTGKEIVFEDSRAYSEFHHAAQALVTKQQYKEISERFANRFIRIQDLEFENSVSIFWLDPQTRIEFSKELDSLNELAEEQLQKDILIKLRESGQYTEADYNFLLENFDTTHFEILNKFPVDTNLLGLTIQWYNEDAKQRFSDYLQEQHEILSKKKEPKATEKEREVIFTEAQYNAYEKNHADLVIGDKMVNGRYRIIVRTIPDKMNAIGFILDHKDEYPLTREQLENYTPLSPKEIEQVLLDFNVYAQDTYFIQKAIRENPKFEELLTTFTTSKILIKRESFDGNLYLQIAWADEESKAIFDEFYATANKLLKQQQSFASLSEDEKKTINISIVSLNDLDLIKSTYVEYRDFYILDDETERGTRKIRWNDLSLKFDFENFTEEKKDELRLKFMDDKISSLIRIDVYTSYKNSNDPLVLQEEKSDKDFIKVYFKDKSERKKFYSWLTKNISQFANVGIIDPSNNYNIYRSLKDFTKDEFSSYKAILYFKNDAAFKDFQEKIYENEFSKIELPKERYEKIAKHLPDVIKQFEVKKDSKQIILYTKDDKAYEAIANFLKPSREFYSTGFESLSYKELNSSPEVSQITFPIDLLKSSDYKSDFYDPLETMRRFTSEAFKKGVISAHILDLISRHFYTYTIERRLDAEKSRRRIEGGKEQRLIICEDCLQEKWVYPDETICHSCQAGVLYSTLLKERNEKQQKKNAAASIQEEA